METAIVDLLTDTIMAEATGRYHARPIDAVLLQESESFVFTLTTGGTIHILRLTHSSHRGAAQLEAELRFINYLADHGLSVALPRSSPAGQRIETIPAGDGAFLAVLFEHAPGQEQAAGTWTPPFVQNWGQFLGRSHALSRRYRPLAAAARRPHWRDEYTIRDAAALLPEQPRVLTRLNALREDLRALPTDSRSYGLIHADLESENFFVADGRLTAFDFDDLAYSWYAYDIAVILRQATWALAPGRQATRGELAAFLRSFMNGYERETHLGDFWLQEMPLLLKLREMVSYVHFQTKWAISTKDAKTQAVDRQLRRQIEEGVPVVDFDLTQI